jgi:alpha-tubulin suppressor-like RCC1 family protein
MTVIPLRSRRPRPLGSLQQSPANIVFVSAGFRHSAVIDRSGVMLTFGSGEDGRLGHGANVSNKRVPEPVAAQCLRGVKLGLVACGGSHTVSQSQWFLQYYFWFLAIPKS